MATKKTFDQLLEDVEPDQLEEVKAKLSEIREEARQDAIDQGNKLDSEQIGEEAAIDALKKYLKDPDSLELDAQTQVKPRVSDKELKKNMAAMMPSAKKNVYTPRQK